jgi:FKBP-type peptidyl-prolyl cis-trans isomerase SlpA
MTPQVQPHSFLTLHYRVSGAGGGSPFISTFEGPASTLTLGCGAFLPGVEARLLGLAEGARVRFDLPEHEAFGPRNPQLLQRVQRSLLASPDEGGDVVTGDVVQFPAPDGVAVYAGVVRELDENTALLDFNHPLAGQAVTFEIELIGIL